MDSGKFTDLNTVNIWTKLDTHRHGREYHHRVAEIALRVGLEYAQMNTILRRLFDKNTKCANKLLALETREVYVTGVQTCALPIWRHGRSTLLC